MAKWIMANQAVPNHEQQVEIACWEVDNNPPFWHLSHAWYHHSSIESKWVRKDGESWPVELWRDSEIALTNEHPWKEDD